MMKLTSIAVQNFIKIFGFTNQIKTHNRYVPFVYILLYEFQMGAQ